MKLDDQITVNAAINGKYYILEATIIMFSISYKANNLNKKKDLSIMILSHLWASQHYYSDIPFITT